MSIFTNARGVAIHDGTFIASSITNNYQSSTTGLDILREASTGEAAHDSSARAYPPRCFPGTRQQYIEDIIHWAIPSRSDTPPPIYWIKGPPGAGKSAIAQTCAEELQEQGVLGAAFFFSFSRRDKPETFFPSIAYQLSTVYPAYRDIIDRTIHHDKTVINKAMRFQFRYLIVEPLRELEESGRGIRRIPILIGGLDECEGADAQREIIRVIATTASSRPLPLCWAFFSRPEPHIEAMFSGITIAPHCSKIELQVSSDINGEIELYLRNGFENIRQQRNTSVDQRWPCGEEMKIIVGAARGSFLYATTVLRFVGHLDPLGPQKRLRTILDTILDRRKVGFLVDASSEAPFAELDAFYTLILQRIPPQILPTARLLFALLCRSGSWGAILIANMLGLSKDGFETVCSHASAAIQFRDPGRSFVLNSTANSEDNTIPKVTRDVLVHLNKQITRYLGGVVSFYHKSFKDFLLDPTRSGIYCVKRSEALIQHYLETHLEYDRRYYWLDSNLVPAPGSPSSILSYPIANRLVDSLIKAYVYSQVGNEDSVDFAIPEELERLSVDLDFRKHLHVSTLYWSMVYSNLHRFRVWGCKCSISFHPGARILWILPNDFSKFNYIGFKLMIAQRLRTGIIRPYHHRSFTSKIGSPFGEEPKTNVESALYCVGYAEKSIFWCWEINHKTQQYREFRTIDLLVVEKIFREQSFG